jgi:hypothetical protein
MKAALARAAATFGGLALTACAATRGFEPPPAEALAQIAVALERSATAAAITLRNDSPWDAQYLFPLFACSLTGELHEDSNPREAARFASGNPERDIWERAIPAHGEARAELSRSPCSGAVERVGVYFKFVRAGATSYRVVWSAPIGVAPAGL